MGYFRFHGAAEFQQVNPQEHQSLTGDPRPFFEQSDNDMLGEQLI
jgi:hypothetical protein